MKNKNTYILVVLFVFLLAVLVGVAINGSPNTQKLILNSHVIRPLNSQSQAKQLAPADTGDGKFKVVGTSRQLANGSTSYSFQVVDLKKNAYIPLYGATAPSGTTMQIPGNSWSPDDKQLFLETNTAQGSDFLVFKFDGTAYSDGQKYLRVSDYWKNSTLKIKTITGWAGFVELTAFTTAADGSRGPSFWFVTSTRKFVQLQTR